MICLKMVDRTGKSLRVTSLNGDLSTEFDERYPCKELDISNKLAPVSAPNHLAARA